MNHAALYCKTLENVTKEELVNALHQSLMQLKAANGTNFDSDLDHKPAITEATRLMVKARHIGFIP